MYEVLVWDASVHPILLCQYLLSILRVEERELVSIFMDVVKHEILAVFPNLCDCMHAHTHTHLYTHIHTDREKRERKPRTACTQSSNGVY